ncbi:MAG TPA: PDZ domain-containing protein [Candidatus Brocadiaceae bacterium]|nr:PDZ domain-containing protein [Candidatus Brocadiaceae bacterium]
MSATFDPDNYFTNGEWKDAIDPSKNYYERMGLALEDAPSLLDVKTAFHKRYDWWRDVNKRYTSNPANTKTKDTGPVSKEAMEKLHDAYTVLSNPEKRSAYNASLREVADKKSHEEFLRIVRIVLLDKVLSLEGKKILLNCAQTLNIDKTTAMEIVSKEMERIGAGYSTEAPARVQEKKTDYYQLLDVNHAATSAEIEAAYKKQCLVWNSLSQHPRFKDSARQKLILLQEAIDTLLDQKKRSKYDRQLLQPAGNPTPKGPKKKGKPLPIIIFAASLLVILFIVGAVMRWNTAPHVQYVQYTPRVTLEPKQPETNNEAVEVEEKASLREGWMGVVVQDLDADLARVFNVSRTEGTLINEIIDNSPAKAAGLECGDIILEYNGIPVRHGNHFLHIVSQTRAGATVKIKLLRDNEEQFVEAVLGEPPEETTAPDAATIPYEKKLGLSLQNVTQEIAQKLHVEKNSGVVVSGVESGSRAAATGLQKGDVINEVNKKEIKSVAGFRRALGSLDREKPFRIHVKRGDISVYMVVKEIPDR